MLGRFTLALLLGVSFVFSATISNTCDNRDLLNASENQWMGIAIPNTYQQSHLWNKLEMSKIRSPKLGVWVCPLPKSFLSTRLIKVIVRNHLLRHECLEEVARYNLLICSVGGLSGNILFLPSQSAKIINKEDKTFAEKDAREELYL
ncbi:hypothetical protein Tco_0271761 [Tanacetum coccineum]